jgi:aryl-alcohol dehydrogenase-like predicted oxidoreductase
MKYIKMTDTDLTVSALCLGTAGMGTDIPYETGKAMLQTFREAGGNFLDTARVYADWVPGGRHASEKMLGRWLKETGCRDEVVIATKGGHPSLDAMHISRLSAADITADVEGSLSDMGIDHIDLYYLHRDDPTIPVEDILEALWALVDAGKLRYLGCSNWALPRIEAAWAYAQQRGRTGFVANQMLWNAAVPDPEKFKGPAPIILMDDATKAWHVQTQMAAIPFSSQANGFFPRVAAGGLDALKPGPKANYGSEENVQRVARAQRFATETGLSLTQITLGYLQAHSFPVSAIVGPRNPEQLADTLTAADITLTPEQAAFLEKGSAPSV